MRTNEEMNRYLRDQRRGGQSGTLPPDPLAAYETLNGYLITQLGVSTTQRFEVNADRAIEAVVDKADMFLVPCVRVRTKRR